MKNSIVKIILLVLPLSFISLSPKDYYREQIGTISKRIISNANGQLGGFKLPSIGIIKVLIVFAQFPDDNYEPENKYWPKGGNPYDMDRWVESNWNENPAQGYLTHYYNDMSFNKLKFIGKEVSVITDSTREWYLTNGWRRGSIHKSIIQKLDSTQDFAEFDNWTCDKSYHHRNVPDGNIDMIIFIWRNIAKDFPSSPKDSVSVVQSRLNFDYDFASIGGNNFKTDNEQRTVMPGNFESGVTVRDYVEDYVHGTKKRTFGRTVHEFAHHLLGHNNYHSGFGFWSMLTSWGFRCHVPNSFERHRLGWINLITIKNTTDPQTISVPSLTDYATTGMAYRFEIDSAKGEYFYIENHQCISFWETAYRIYNIEKGIYVLRQDASIPSTSNDDPPSAYFRMIPADGRFDWAVNQMIDNPYGAVPDSLPVFKNLGPNIENGYHDLQHIPWTWNGKKQKPAPIHFIEDENGKPVESVKYQGDGSDAFRLGFNETFNATSNPNNQNANRKTAGFGFKIKSLKDGIYSIDIFTGLK